MIEKPPKWSLSRITPSTLNKLFHSHELRALIKKAQQDYVYWDKFKYYSFPKGVNAKEAWVFLKISRKSNSETTPVKSIGRDRFTYNLSNLLQQKLSYIDRYGAGLLKGDMEKPNEAQATQLIISGLSEEAIASSQIEGASTSRKVAKDMLLSERTPRTRDEQMILNNYKVMQRLQEWKDLDLSQKMLLEMQKQITTGTLDDESQSGRFRKDADEIVVLDSLTGEVAYIPPKEGMMKAELKRLIAYANHEEEDSNFVHRVIKAIVLHFWLAYLHPFADGNGRTARALFYWFLLKKNYWMFQYLSVSRVIRETRKQYDRAFLHSEYDDNDLTYFLLYISKVTERSIEEFLFHYKEKIKEAEQLRKIAVELRDFNDRQVALLKHVHTNSGEHVSILMHQNKHGVAYETARADLLDLVKKGCLAQIQQGRRHVFVSNSKAVSRLLKKV